MKRLLRNRRTGDFWADEEWNTDRSRAHDFADITSLLRVVFERGLADAEAVMQFGDQPDPEYNVNLKLSDPGELRLQVKSRSGGSSH